MHSFNKPSRITITCSKRLTPYLQQELASLHYKTSSVFQTGINLNGTLNDCIRLNMNLRCASQIYYSLKSFQCNNTEELYDIISTIQWENIIDSKGYFSITSTVNTASVNNNLFVNVKIKDAIADRFRDKTNERPDSGPSENKTVIHLFWKDDLAELFIDTSGPTLAKHNYRKIPGQAPMLESLASATILASSWNKKSPFINPMCGSGTLAIEAAMIATNRAPGLFRSDYGFMHILGYEPSFFENEKKHLVNQVMEVPGLKIIATDYSEDAINISRINAGAASVGDIIEFEVCNFENTEIPENAHGVIFFNPEYGERLGDEIMLEETYALIGDFLKKKCQGYTGYIFTGNLNLAKKIGLKAKKRIEFYNGKIDCRLLEYELYRGSREAKTL